MRVCVFSSYLTFGLKIFEHISSAEIILNLYDQ